MFMYACVYVVTVFLGTLNCRLLGSQILTSTCQDALISTLNFRCFPVSIDPTETLGEEISVLISMLLSEPGRGSLLRQTYNSSRLEYAETISIRRLLRRMDIGPTEISVRHTVLTVFTV